MHRPLGVFATSKQSGEWACGYEESVFSGLPTGQKPYRLLTLITLLTLLTPLTLITLLTLIPGRRASARMALDCL